MAMFHYESEEFANICQGSHSSDTLYAAECKQTIIQGVKGSYPQLCGYEKEWLMYGRDHYEGGEPSNLEYQTVSVNPVASVENAIPFHYKRASLKGSTKYRDIDTGDILDTFDETKNLELISVEMPVLTTSNGDGTKTNILTTPEDLELRGIGDVKDELNLSTGELTQRIGEVVLDGSENWIAEPFTSGGKQLLRFCLSHVSNCKGNAKALCDKEKVIAFDHANEDYVRPSRNLIWIYRKDLTTTVVDLKQQLQANPITVQYELATESIKTVALSHQIKPYEGVNHYEVSSITISPIGELSVPVVSTGAQTLNDILTNE